ncbi:MAG: phospholipid carrier-dependent glycosyltransferase [Acidobacteria bacterium]|nr:phospholipid carrier-dependent glycosyltransferase [Acidobacteriota bacterium]
MHRTHVVAFGAVLLVGLWLRAPQISANLPYFYDADETTSFNRLVRMVQTSDYHPYFFFYPSLHLYLRMPALAGGFLWSAREGDISSVHDIVRIDNNVPDGIARTASHPHIVMWVRSVTLFFSLLMIVSTVGITRRLTASPWAGILAGALVACSAPLIRDSEKIGVDTVMAAMCLVTVWLSLRTMEQPTVGRAALAGLAAGLSVSSKYNAMPIVAVPVLACLLSARCTPGMLAATLGLPAVGFFAGTPYGLLYPASLLNGLAEQVSHYGLYARDGTVDPGWPQARRFLLWMLGPALGATATLTGVAGAVLMVCMEKYRRTAIVALAFPVAYGMLMFDQRVYYNRNMLVLIPFFAVAAAWMTEQLVTYFSARSRTPGRSRATITALVILLISQPAVMAIDVWLHAGTAPESRHLVTTWLAETNDSQQETVIAASLQLPSRYRANGISVARTDELTDPRRLFLDGYDRIVVGPDFALRAPSWATDLMQVHRVFAGYREQTYIPLNPEVTVYDLPATLAYAPEVRALVEQDARYEVTDGTVRTRVARLPLDAKAIALIRTRNSTITLDLRSRWPSQSCRLELAIWQSPDLCANLQTNEWRTTTVPVPTRALTDRTSLWIVNRRVHGDPDAPRQEGLRRLGLEVQGLTISPAP